MFQIIETISSWALKVIDQTGYLGVFLLSFLDRAAISLVPAEIVLPFIGFLVGQERFVFWIAMAVVIIAGLAGDLFLYWISLKFGRRILEKYGRYLLVSKHDLNRTDELFKKHGGKIVLISRFIPIIRSLIPIPAGIARMNLGKFILYTLAGSLPWKFGLIFAGLKAGENWDTLSLYFHKFDFVIIGIIAVAIVWYIYRHIKKKHSTHG